LKSLIYLGRVEGYTNAELRMRNAECGMNSPFVIRHSQLFHPTPETPDPKSFDL
jgi:hypothetical protein